MGIVDKSFYNTVLSMTFSSCGNYFVCGNIFGDVAVFKLKQFLKNANDDIDEDPNKLNKNRSIVTVNESYQISSLVSTEQFLIAGIRNEIYGWSWNDLVSIENNNSSSLKCSWKINIPASSETTEAHPEVNYLKFGPGLDGQVSENILYAGCGNNNVYSFSLEDGRLLKTYTGHTDYVHSIDIKDNLLVSGSEDGSVRIWDTRSSSIVNILEPYKNKEIHRPDLGPWIGDVSLNDDWLLCGGGARLSLWNLRTMDIPMTVFNNTQDSGIHVAKLYEDKILTGGQAPSFSLLNYNDEVQTEIESSNNTIFSCAVCSLENFSKVLCICGNGNHIDVSTNFKFREYVIPFY